MMKQTSIALGAIAVVLSMAALVFVAPNFIAKSRATPPQSMTNVQSCVAWLKNPIDARRVESNGTVYYVILGPAGKSLASGPAGYTFDQQGQFLAWSVDLGDIKQPPQIFDAGAKWKPIAFDDLRRLFPESSTGK